MFSIVCELHLTLGYVLVYIDRKQNRKGSHSVPLAAPTLLSCKEGLFLSLKEGGMD